MRLVPWFVLSLAVSLPGTAQQGAPSSLQTLRAAEPYQRAIAVTDQKYESSLSTRCLKVDLQLGVSQARVSGTLQTNAQGGIVNGTWTETTPGTACGVKRLYNVFVVIKDGKPGLYALFPGRSAATPLLQHDATTYVSIGANAPKGCPVDIVNTDLPRGAPASARLPWEEKWTTSACGRHSLVTVHFIPDATGTTINVSPKETVPLP